MSFFAGVSGTKHFVAVCNSNGTLSDITSNISTNYQHPYKVSSHCEHLGYVQVEFVGLEGSTI